jgi:thioesterase domain-containing protein
VNENFERQVLLAKMYELKTLRGLFEYLQTEEQDDLDNLLFPIRAEGRGRPLFAVRTYLKHVALDLETGYPIYGLSHGDQAPEERGATLENLASRYRVSIKHRQPSGPYRIAGYSFGALLALEIAHQIAEAGESVERLILIDPPPPVPEGDVRFKARRIRKRIQKSDRLTERISAASAEIGKNIKRFVTRRRYRIIRTMDRILERRSRHDATKQAFADWSKKARQAYRHKPYDGNTLLILMGREGEETPDQQVARWDGILTGCLDVRVIEGPDDHVALMQPPWSSRVATAVNEMFEISVRVGRASLIRSR